MSGARVLIVEDEPQMQRSLRLILADHGYDVTVAGTGERALQEFNRRLPDVVLLDLMLPQMDGIEVCRRMRATSGVAIIVLSARGDEHTKVAAFELGADDYLTKPFGARELLARVQVAIRHTAGQPSEVFVIGALRVDLLRRQVALNDQPVALTPREYDVLKFLITHPDRVLTHAVILREIWGAEFETQAQYLRNVVLALRRKIEADPAHPRLIVTEPGIGYRFATEP
jgi:two-component system KDP operon response regulator KdpE